MQTAKVVRIVDNKVSLMILVAAACMLGMFLSTMKVHAESNNFTVNVSTDESDANSGDGICETINSGECTLRAAIEQANADGNSSDVDEIDFNIIGTGVHTINVGSTLTVYEPVLIDGYTQPGSQQNTNPSPQPLNSTITIELRWNGPSSSTVLLIDSSASNSQVRGMAINGGSTAISVAAPGSVIAGNYINTDASGITVPDDGSTTRSLSGIQIEGSGSAITLGGINPEDRNIITNCDLQGLSVSAGDHDALIYGNYIGLGKDGVTDLGSVNGIQLSDGSGQIIIGGSGSGMRNVISGFSNSGVLFLDSNDVLQGNYIGTDYTGNVNTSITNSVAVAFAFNSTGNLVGGTGSGEGNIIRGASGAGITAIGMNLQEFSMLLTPRGNSILGNVISDIGIFDYPNFGDSNLAIDNFVGNIPTGYYPPTSYDSQGPTSNDTNDVDVGPNDYINTPVLKTAQQVGTQLTITYDLDAADSPENHYRVEFFTNDESTIFGTGPAQEYIGAVNTSVNGNDLTATFTVSGDYTNKALSATATAVDDTTISGFGSTSELARNISIGTATDFDSDGISSASEDLGPNNGDGNNDGTPDKDQPTVTTYEIDSTGIYATLVTEGCSENGTVASLDATTINAIDTGKDYPYGFTNFTLNCSRGDTVDVTMYIHTTTNPDLYIPRKYNMTTQSFLTIPNSTLTTETVGSSTALKLTYSITDGGDLDDDQTANGIIVDPVGLATNQGAVTTGPFAGIGVPNTGLR